MSERLERACVACGKPTAVNNIEGGYCEAGSDLACALWQLDEARAEAKRWRDDYIAVADAVGMVGWAEGQGPAQIASVEELVACARAGASALLSLEEWQEAAAMACETPLAGCDCHGCSYAREKAREARWQAAGFEPVSEERRAENLLVNLGIAK